MATNPQSELRYFTRPVGHRVPAQRLIRVLVVDKDRLIRMNLLECLGEHYRVDVTRNSREALIRLSATAYDLVISDVEDSHLDRANLSELVFELFPDTPLVFMSGRDSWCDAVQGGGLRSFQRTPVTTPHLLEVLDFQEPLAS